jgi:hypothetical protein
VRDSIPRTDEARSHSFREDIMPAFVIVPSQRRSKTGELDANLCDPGPTGSPDRRTTVPVKIKIINDRVLSVDGSPREIVSCTGMNGTTTYLISFNSQRLPQPGTAGRPGTGLVIAGSIAISFVAAQGRKRRPRIHS